MDALIFVRGVLRLNDVCVQMTAVSGSAQYQDVGVCDLALSNELAPLVIDPQLPLEAKKVDILEEDKIIKLARTKIDHLIGNLD